MSEDFTDDTTKSSPTIENRTPRKRGRSGAPQRHRRWSVVTVVVLFAAGALISATASEAGGTSLRAEQDVELRELVPERNADVRRLSDLAERLRTEVDALTDALGVGDDDIVAEQERADEFLEAAGLTAVHGPGIQVSLDDAPRQADGSLPRGATVNDVVVHQQDVQAVVNALWSGGAEAVAIMGVRLISTSAVRCVGNTLLLHGQVYSPPFVIEAIGDTEGMADALEEAPGVRAFRAAADDFGLGYATETFDDRELPEYDGPLNLVDAEVPS